MAGSATSTDLAGGIIKGLFYATMHLTGTMPDWDELKVCMTTYDFIMRKCPSGRFKCTDPSIAMDRTPRCHSVWDSFGRGKDDPNNYVCKVIDWWDACCETREPLQKDERSCEGCGQDMYGCQCAFIGDGVRPTH